MDQEKDFAQGVAITSISHLDDKTSLEVVRYPRGSGFFRLLSGPYAPGKNVWTRVGNALGELVRHPIRSLKAFFVRDLAKSSQILLFMQSSESTLTFRRGWLGGLSSRVGSGPAPSAAIPEATHFTRRFAEKMDGVPFSMVTETLLGIPTTAHILGGCCMGKDADEGVIDCYNQVFGYRDMYVIDGSMISANLGVNPSLTITALAERTMSHISHKELEEDEHSRTESAI